MIKNKKDIESALEAKQLDAYKEISKGMGKIGADKALLALAAMSVAGLFVASPKLGTGACGLMILTGAYVVNKNISAEALDWQRYFLERFKSTPEK